jgi:TonB family protein
VDSDPLIISQTAANYTREAREAQYSGTVILSALIDERGIPTDIQVVQSQPYGLDDEAIKALQEWRFRPAVKNGQVARVRITLNFPFNIDSK